MATLWRFESSSGHHSKAGIAGFFVFGALKAKHLRASREDEKGSACKAEPGPQNVGESDRYQWARAKTPNPSIRSWMPALRKASQ